MKKFRPELIKVVMQILRKDILSISIQCTEDEDKDAIYIHDDDVNLFKKMACCSYDKEYKFNSKQELAIMISNNVTEWLIDNTKLPIYAGLELSTYIIDKVKDLEYRVESILYFNRLGIYYFNNKPELVREINGMVDNVIGNIITMDNLLNFKHRMINLLRSNGEEVFPIIEIKGCKSTLDFRVRDKEINLIWK